MRHANRSPDPAPIVLDAIHAFALMAAGMLVDGRLVECQQALFSAAKLGTFAVCHCLDMMQSCSWSWFGSESDMTPLSSHFSIIYFPLWSTAIPSGLHQIRSLSISSNPSVGERQPAMIPRPTSETDVRRRVGVFWQLLCLGESLFF